MTIRRHCYRARCHALVVCLLLCPSVLAQPYLVSGARPNCTIVVEKNAGGLFLLAASELQRYLGELTGGRPEIADPAGNPILSKGHPLILVGGPDSNSLVKKAVAAGQADFRGLKPEGFLLKTIEIDGQPALVIGGNDEAGTLYGA